MAQGWLILGCIWLASRWHRHHTLGARRWDRGRLLENSGCPGLDDDILPTNNPNCKRIIRTIELQSSCNLLQDATLGAKKKAHPSTLERRNTWHSHHHHHQQHRHCFFCNNSLQPPMNSGNLRGGNPRGGNPRETSRAVRMHFLPCSSNQNP